MAAVETKEVKPEKKAATSMFRNRLPFAMTWKRDKLKRHEIALGALGPFLLFLQLAFCCIIIFGKNGYQDSAAALSNTCTEGYTGYGVYCIDYNLFYASKTKALEFCSRGATFDGDVDSMNFDNPHATLESPRRLLDDAMKYENTDYGEMTPGFLEHVQPKARRLDELTKTMWDIATQHFVVPTVLIPLTIVVAIFWLFMMCKFPKFMIYLGIAIALLCCVFYMFYPLIYSHRVCDTGFTQQTIANDLSGTRACEDLGGMPKLVHGQVGWYSVFPMVLILASAYLLRRKISVASETLVLCTRPLKDLGAKDIVPTLVPIFFAFMLYALIFSNFTWSLYDNFQWHCVINEKGVWKGMRIAHVGKPTGKVFLGVTSQKIFIMPMALLLVLTYTYFENMVAVVVATGIGGWYFRGAKQRPERPTRQGLRWAFSSSSHVIMFMSLVVKPIVTVRSVVYGWPRKIRYLFFLPPVWVYYGFSVMWTLILRQFITYTRFMLICHTFHCGDIFMLSRRSWSLLKLHLQTLLLSSCHATTVIKILIYFMSLGLFGVSWIWMEQVVGEGFLSEYLDGTAVDGWYYAGLCMILAMLMSFFPLCTLMFVGISGSWVTQERLGVMAPKLQCWMVALMISSVGNLVFMILGSLLNSTLDTVFYIYALQAEEKYAAQKNSTEPVKKNCTPESDEIMEFIEERLVKPLPEWVKVEEKELARVVQVKGGNIKHFLGEG